MLTVEARGEVVVVAPGAPTDLTVAEARLFDEAADAVPGGADVVLDLAAVGFLDSAGIGCIVRLNRRLQDGGGELRLAGPGQAVTIALELVRLHRLLEVYPSVDEAVASFGAGEPT